MLKPELIVACLCGFLLGIGATCLYGSYSSNRGGEHERWISLSTPANGEKDLVTYSSDALFNSDIKLPDIKSITGKAKFVKGTTNNPADIKLGYMVDVNIPPLDTAALPPKYQPPIGGTDNPEAKKPPLDTVYYEVVFYFILKDKDGFPLAKMASNKETVHSGAVNHIQLFASSYVPPQVAANTESIEVRMEAVKCLTCQNQPGERRHSHPLF